MSGSITQTTNTPAATYSTALAFSSFHRSNSDFTSTTSSGAGQYPFGSAPFGTFS